MTEIWQLGLIIGATVISLVGIIDACIKLAKYIKYGKNNADAFFEKKVREVTNSMIQEEMEKSAKARELEFKAMRDFISCELKPINENILEIKLHTQQLQHATINDLKIKLRSLYHDSFEVNGVLTTIEKSNWDKWFSDYTLLGGNSDVKTMNDHIQKVYLEITLEKQKQKANRKKKGVEQI